MKKSKRIFVLLIVIGFMIIIGSTKEVLADFGDIETPVVVSPVGP